MRLLDFLIPDFTGRRVSLSERILWFFVGKRMYCMYCHETKFIPKGNHPSFKNPHKEPVYKCLNCGDRYLLSDLEKYQENIKKIKVNNSLQ